jgi:hypothetical protein
MTGPDRDFARAPFSADVRAEQCWSRLTRIQVEFPMLAGSHSANGFATILDSGFLEWVKEFDRGDEGKGAPINQGKESDEDTDSLHVCDCDRLRRRGALLEAVCRHLLTDDAAARMRLGQRDPRRYLCRSRPGISIARRACWHRSARRPYRNGDPRGESAVAFDCLIALLAEFLVCVASLLRRPRSGTYLTPMLVLLGPAEDGGLVCVFAIRAAYRSFRPSG